VSDKNKNRSFPGRDKRHNRECPRCSGVGWAPGYVCLEHKHVNHAIGNVLPKNCRTCALVAAYGILGCPVCYRAPQAYKKEV